MRTRAQHPWRARAFSLVGLAAAATGAALVGLACEDDPHLRTSPEQAAGGGGACEAESGELPPPNCDDSENQCTSRPGCAIDEARCGSKSTCLPIGDNAGKAVQDFRIRRLKIARPAALAGEFIQNTVVTLNIDLAEKACGEQGKGLFSWLLRVDREKKLLVTGGAPPPTDAIGQGFCFARFDLGASKVEPLTSRIEFEGDTFRTVQPQRVTIPIFLSQELATVILLPLSDVVVSGVTISNDGNCIGRLDPLALDPGCFDDSLCSKWKTAGALGGYMTLEEADAVRISILQNKTLCSFLAGDTGLVCARDAAGKIAYRGDYCSTDKKAGSCGDSVWLAATFAASAAKIFDGTGTVAACSATSVADAGPDASADAATDGPDPTDAADAADAD